MEGHERWKDMNGGRIRAVEGLSVTSAAFHILCCVNSLLYQFETASVHLIFYPVTILIL